MFEKQIEAYEMLRKEYMQRVTSRMKCSTISMLTNISLPKRIDP